MKNKIRHSVVFISVLLFAFTWLNASAQTATDDLFKEPYVDVDEWRDNPVRHRYVHGGFKGTDTRFSFYFPIKEKYQGRFFQYITPVPDSENISQAVQGEGDRIGFTVSHGSYFIETNGGGTAAMARFGSGVDPLIGAYKANAACARYSRTLAAEMYGQHRTYGYAFGGSGGAYRTLGGMENTDVWDGVVPYVVGSPMAIPNVFTVRMHAMQVLNKKFPQIADALEPGGSGDMYAGLNEEERSALAEATNMGFPPKAWFAYETMGIHAFAVLYQGVTMADPQYFKDFWTLPGYLGSNPPAYLREARVQKVSKIKSTITSKEAVALGLTTELAGEARGTADAAWKSIGGEEGSMPVAFQLEDLLPNVYFLGGDLLIKSGAAAGKKISLTNMVGDRVILGPTDPKTLSELKAGDEVQVDNSDFLAAQTYHRHQVPGKDYHAWDQFKDKDGKPLYPQRPMLLGPLFTQAASGVVPNGRFTGKMILLESMWDSEAFPWQADWYRSKVVKNLGDATDKNFRVWFTDHANHADYNMPNLSPHIVSYVGVIQQALLDLSEWVEKGVEPPTTTNYEIKDSQVIVPDKASDRKGIQPTIVLTINGQKSITTTVGKSVTFEAFAEVPPNAGNVVSGEWYFENTGALFSSAKLVKDKKQTSRVVVREKYTFTKPGIYFPTLRVVSQRKGDEKTPYTRIKNLDRVRVVVK